jgi:Hg(II)-responsive transcriptional regulator
MIGEEDEATMRIGEVAKSAGVRIDTLRYYERRGLIDEPERVGAGYRAYGADVPRVIRFIKRAQELGFTLAEVQELLALRDGAGGDRTAARGVAETKLAEIDEKIRALQAMRGALAHLVAQCRAHGTHLACPILDALDGDNRRHRHARPRKPTRGR